MPDNNGLRYVEPSLQAAQPGRFETPYYAAYTNSGDLGAATFANDGQKVRLLDPKTGAVLYEGVGSEGAKYATGYANALSQDDGRKARWAIQIANGDDWTTTGADSKDSRSLLSSIGHTIGKVAPYLAAGALGAATGGLGLIPLAAGLVGKKLLGGGGGGGDDSDATADKTVGTPESLSPTFSAQLPAPSMAARVPVDTSGIDFAHYGQGPEQSFFARVPQPAAPPPVPPPVPPPATGMAHGGSFAVRGMGSGRSDSMPAKLSDGEYVIDAETVALLGDGSNRAGADALDQFRANVRRHKGRQLAEGRFSADAKAPEAYMRAR